MSLCIVRHDSDSRKRYDWNSKTYSIIMCNYFTALFYLLRISTAFCFVVAALIRERCLSKSLLYEFNAYLMYYGNCLTGDRRCWLKGQHQISSVSWIYHQSLHFHIYQIVWFVPGILCPLYFNYKWWGGWDKWWVVDL